MPEVQRPPGGHGSPTCVRAALSGDSALRHAAIHAAAQMARIAGGLDDYDPDTGKTGEGFVVAEMLRDESRKLKDAADRGASLPGGPSPELNGLLAQWATAPDHVPVEVTVGFLRTLRAALSGGTPDSVDMSVLLTRMAALEVAVGDIGNDNLSHRFDRVRQAVAALSGGSLPGGPSPEVSHAMRYLEHFVTYRPGEWGHPQREKAESCLATLYAAALRGAQPASQPPTEEER